MTCATSGLCFKKVCMCLEREVLSSFFFFHPGLNVYEVVSCQQPSLIADESCKLRMEEKMRRRLGLGHCLDIYMRMEVLTCLKYYDFGLINIPGNRI